MGTNKTTVSVYADEELMTALNEFKDSGNHKSLNVAIVAILREKLFGEASQGKVSGNLQSTLAIQTMIDDALSSLILELREEFEEHEAIMVSRSQKAFEEQIKIFRVEMDEAIAPLLARLEALETNRSEATAPANFTQALLQKAKEVAPMKLKEIA